MITIDGKPLVEESAARLDLANEFGVLYANFRNTTLENEALVKRLQATNDELSAVRASCTSLGEKLREMTAIRDTLAKQVRKPKKA